MNTNTSGLFTLDWKSIGRGIVVAIFTGIALPIAAIVQTPGFDITHVDVHSLLVLALNGAIVGFVGYIAKSFVSNSQGQVFGKSGL